MRLKAKHHWGVLKIRAKASNLVEKIRPMLGYHKHCAKDVLAATNAAGHFIMAKVNGGQSILTLDPREVVRKIQRFNVQIKGWSETVVKKKNDFGNFFNKCPRSVSYRALEWLEDTIAAQTRRSFVAVPTKQTLYIERKHSHSERVPRSYGGTLRPYSQSHKRKQGPYFTTSRNVLRGFHALKIVLVRAIALIDMHNYVFRFRGRFFRQIVGFPQGSQVSMFLANLVAAFFERTGYNTFSILYETKILGIRWVDDLFWLVALRLKAGWEETEDLTAVEEGARIINDIMSRYQPLQYKNEPDDIFVGIEVVARPDSVSIRCANPNRNRVRGCSSVLGQTQLARPRIVHPQTNFPRKMIRGLLIGLLIMEIDRAFEEDVLKESITDLLWEMMQVGHPIVEVSKALHAIQCRYPYLESSSPWG